MAILLHPVVAHGTTSPQIYREHIQPQDHPIGNFGDKYSICQGAPSQGKLY
jgi:hypothetical protein